MRFRALLAAALLCALPARAEIRVQRVLDWRSGLPASFTVQIEQDPTGFLWITTTGGVVRYDGNEARVVAPAPQDFVTGSVTAGRPMFMRPRAVGVGEILDGDGKPVADPRPGSPLLGACVTRDGTLWSADEHGLWVRDGTAWRGPILLPGGRNPEGRVWLWDDHRVLSATDDEAYVVASDGAATLLAPARAIVAVARMPDGTGLLACWRRDGGHVLEVRNGKWREIQHSGSRLIGVAARGEVIWIAYDGILIRIPPGGPQEIIGPEQGFTGGGAMLVDREGSLWVATIRGLLQYPEPETTSLLDRYTLGARDIARTPQAVWVSSWSGLMIHRRTAGGWQSAMSQASYVDPVCLAADGAVWTLAPGHFFRHDPSGVGFRTVPVEGPNPPAYALACGEGRDGRVWFPTDGGVFVLEAGAQAPRRVPAPRPPADAIWEVAAEDGEGNLWVGLGNRVCRAPTARMLAGDAAPWSCETVPGMLHLTALRVTPSGDLWAATSAAGVWRRHEGRFTRIPASDALGSPVTRALVPSPSGGLWIVGEANCVRVEERPDAPAGWEVRERVGVWQGLPTSGLMDLTEDADGTLWLATDMSLVRVPPEARRARPQPPPVAVVEASVDGKPISTTGEVALPYGKNRLEVRFAALSYREPALIRYRTRLKAGDPWSEPTAQSSFRFVDLPAGRYRIEVQGSLDGKHWSPTEVAVAARVLPPWWKHAWFLGAVLALLLALLALAYRVRVRQLLRLERQRTQIAMDLHDAIGSGLGSIRILSGLAVRETTPEATRATVSARIAEISDELATALGDIVWSLRPGTGNLEALGTQLVARATPLVTAQGMTLETSLPPAIPEVSLSLAVRRHVFLVGLEAAHNAARHSGGSRVALALERAGRRWRLRVEDDGRGLSATQDGNGRRGLGLESIRRRAAEIGAEALWEERPGGGTIFTLTFDGRADVSHDHATGAGGRPPASSGQP